MRKTSLLLAAGASTLSFQNALVFLSLLLFLAGGALAFDLVGASFVIDYVGMALLGLGLVLLSGRLRTSEVERTTRSKGLFHRERRLLTLSGLLCLIWVFLTFSWRWAIPSLTGHDFQGILLQILDSEGGLPGQLVPYETHLRVMFILWMAASSVLLAAAYLLKFSSKRAHGPSLLEEQISLRSWEGFATLNAVGTFLVAIEMLRMISGEVGGPFLLGGIVLKVIFVPLNGAFAYAFLAKNAVGLRKGPLGQSRKRPRPLGGSGESLRPDSVVGPPEEAPSDGGDVDIGGRGD